MPVATETALLPLRDGMNPEEKASTAASVLHKSCSVVASRKGFVRQFWGISIEDPKLLVWTIDWEDIQDHKNFTNSEDYKPFLADIAEIVDLSTVLLYHTNFLPDAAPPRQAPVTEFISFKIPANAADDLKSSVEDTFLKVAKACMDMGNATSYACGWVLEETEHPKAPDSKAIAFTGRIGWPSKEDHMTLRDNPDFVEILKPMRSLVLPPEGGKPPFFHVKLHGKPTPTT